MNKPNRLRSPDLTWCVEVKQNMVWLTKLGRTLLDLLLVALLNIRCSCVASKDRVGVSSALLETGLLFWSLLVY